MSDGVPDLPQLLHAFRVKAHLHTRRVPQQVNVRRDDTHLTTEIAVDQRQPDDARVKYQRPCSWIEPYGHAGRNVRVKPLDSALAVITEHQERHGRDFARPVGASWPPRDGQRTMPVEPRVPPDSRLASYRGARASDPSDERSHG